MGSERGVPWRWREKRGEVFLLRLNVRKFSYKMCFFCLFINVILYSAYFKSEEVLSQNSWTKFFSVLLFCENMHLNVFHHTYTIFLSGMTRMVTTSGGSFELSSLK